MDREILFRGKRIDNGAWVEGYVVVYPSGKTEVRNKCTQPPDILLVCEIDPETVCQYTGLTDKNGKKIFEGDIVEDSQGNLYKAFWQENYYQFSFICIKSEKNFLKDAKWDLWSLAKNDELSLCGNIFDNPSLLEGGSE